MTQCLGLSLLSSSIVTLGRGPSNLGAVAGGVVGGGTGVSRTREDTHMRELQGSQVCVYVFGGERGGRIKYIYHSERKHNAHLNLLNAACFFRSEW